MLIAGAVGALVFLLVSTIEGLWRPGYSLVRHPVSALALGSRGGVQTASFLVCGALIAVGGVGLWTTSWLLGAGVVVLGVGLVLSGVCPMDPMRGYPPGTPDGDPTSFSTAHRRHDQAGLVVFLLLPALPLVGALTPELPSAMRWASGALALAVGLGVAAFTRDWEADSPRAGLTQRLTLAAGLGWLAWLLLAAPGHPG